VCRDIKPENVLLSQVSSAAGQLNAKLTDFGLCAVSDLTLGVIMGVKEVQQLQACTRNTVLLFCLSPVCTLCRQTAPHQHWHQLRPGAR
jgi:serine/threonine protein kinase